MFKLTSRESCIILALLLSARKDCEDYLDDLYKELQYCSFEEDFERCDTVYEIIERNEDWLDELNCLVDKFNSEV